LFTGRRVDILDNGSLKIQYNRNRYYDYYTGRWLTHDPLGYVDGMNLYEYGRSNPPNRLDPSGLWMGWHHGDLTKKALKAWVSGLPSTSKPSRKCKKKMLKTLRKANVSQDKVLGPTIYEHHYLRKYIPAETLSDKVAADKNYETYLKSEETNFNLDLGLLTGCWKALEALGRMDHALQDFYGHAIKRTGGFDPFDAWPTTTGTPYQRANFWPASYNDSPPPSGEHPNAGGGEPVSAGSSEGVDRKKAAFNFMIGHYKTYLGKWWKQCKCMCCG
jgi:RHS repeat-associated protein